MLEWMIHLWMEGNVEDNMFYLMLTHHGWFVLSFPNLVSFLCCTCRRIERKFSEQNIGAPPSYEEAVSESRSPARSERY